MFIGISTAQSVDKQNARNNKNMHVYMHVYTYNIHT